MKKWIWVAGIFVLFLILVFGSFFTGSFKTGFNPMLATMQYNMGTLNEVTSDSAPGMMGPLDSTEESFKSVADLSRVQTGKEVYGIPNSGMYPPVGEGVERKIIKNAWITLIVGDITDAIKNIQRSVEEHKGYVVTSNVEDAGGARATVGQMLVRVPSQNFDVFLATLRDYGIRVSKEKISGQDVTEEYVDLEARLKNLKITEAQLSEIMTRAEKIEDVLNVQRELSNVRSNIESLEGRKKYLDQSGAYATVTIDLYTDLEKIPLTNETDPWQPYAVFKNALRNLIVLFQALVSFVIWFAVLSPIWLIFAVIIFVIYRHNKNKK